MAEGPAAMGHAPAPNSRMAAWAALSPAEGVLEPELPIIDAHHHLWDRRPSASGLPRQDRWMLPEILSDIAECGHNVRATVYVQAGSFHRASGPESLRPVGETEFVQGCAAMCEADVYGPTHPTPVVGAAIVGTCDLRSPDVADVLAAHMRCRNFRGIRMQRRQSSPVPLGLDDDAFRRGMAAMARHGLVYDVWQTSAAERDFGSVRRVVALAREFPGVTIVLNHLGTTVGPLMSAEELRAWRADVSELAAACPNVVAKVGGIQMPVNGWGLERRDRPVCSSELLELWPFYSHAISAFGPSRCMFETNFPVDKDCVSMRVLYNTLKLVAARLGMSYADKVAIFHDTAARVYGLPVATAAAPARRPGPAGSRL